MIFPKTTPFTKTELILSYPFFRREKIQIFIETSLKNGIIKKIGTRPYGRKIETVYCDAALLPLSKSALITKNITTLETHLTKKQVLFLKRVFTKETLREILKTTERGILGILKIHNKGSRTSLISDNYSTLLGTNTAKIIHDKFGNIVVISGTDNKKSDLTFPEIDDLHVEIKATANNAWSGGKLSKRPYPTLLVSYDVSDKEYFVALVPHINWEIGRNSYYATFLSWQDFRDKYPEKKILFGAIGLVGERGNAPQMIRESL